VAACKFCQIVAGEVSAHVVLETDAVLAFLDHRPLFPGHTLVVPKQHVDTLVELPADQLPSFFTEVQRLARVIPGVMDATGTFVAANNVVSQSVPHLHFHVVPRRPKDGLRGFFWPRTKYQGDLHMAETAEQIRAALR
jgi:histidine triad (HIT) family protein